MAGFINSIISIFQKRISDLPDKPNATAGLTADQLKEYFDSSPEELRVAFNTAMALLESITPGASGSESIGSATIPGISGNTVYAQIANLLAIAQAAQAGTIIAGSIDDTKLSNAAGQIKDRVATLTTAVANVNPVGSTVYAYKNLGGAI